MYVNKLKNGLSFCIENIDSDFVTISYFVHAGSFDEPDDKLGIAHLTEHLVFKGTMNREAKSIFTEIEQLGGSMNAYTTEDHTVFYVTILKEHWKEALDVLSDIIWNNTIPEEEFDRERNVVLEELKMYHDDGSRRILDNMTKVAYKDAKNKWNNGGTIASVSNITKQDVENFIDNFYIPDKITIYITGNINCEEVTDFIDKYTSNYKFDDEIKEFRDNSCIVNVENNEEDIDTTQSHMVAYFPYKFEQSIKNFIIADMALDIFGNGFSSRLIEIREKYGYAYTICCSMFSSFPESLIYVYVGLNKNNIDNTQKLILKKMKEIKENGITEKEFETSYNCYQTLLKKKSLFTESMNDFRISLMGMGIDLNNVDFQNIVEQLETISIDDLNNFYKNVFDVDNVGFITLLQTKSEE